MDRLPLQFMMLILAGWVNRHQQEAIEYLQEENRVLREQLGGKRFRFSDVERRRLARRAHPIGRRRLSELATLVTPDTLLHWYRELVARKYDGSKKRGPGRPRASAEVRRLIVEMACDNPRWGYTRIQGALRNLGHEIGRNTIKRILIENGLDSVGGRRTTWKAFLSAHWGAIVATDFFTVEVVTWRGLVRYFVLFVIDLKTRRIEVAGITRSPDGRWMGQVARNLTDVESSFSQRTRYLIHDRDPLFTEQFGHILEGSGVEAPGAKPESECACGAVRSVDQVGVLEADHSSWRAPPSPSDLGIHRALPSRAKSPRPWQRADRKVRSRVARRWSRRMPGAAGRGASLLPESGVGVG